MCQSPGETADLHVCIAKAVRWHQTISSAKIHSKKRNIQKLTFGEVLKTKLCAWKKDPFAKSSSMFLKVWEGCMIF